MFIVTLCAICAKGYASSCVCVCVHVYVYVCDQNHPFTDLPVKYLHERGAYCLLIHVARDTSLLDLLSRTESATCISPHLYSCNCLPRFLELFQNIKVKKLSK